MTLHKLYYLSKGHIYRYSYIVGVRVSTYEFGGGSRDIIQIITVSLPENLDVALIPDPWCQKQNSDPLGSEKNSLSLIPRKK